MISKLQVHYILFVVNERDQVLERVLSIIKLITIQTFILFAAMVELLEAWSSLSHLLNHILL